MKPLEGADAPTDGKQSVSIEGNNKNIGLVFRTQTQLIARCSRSTGVLERAQEALDRQAHRVSNAQNQLEQPSHKTDEEEEEHAEESCDDASGTALFQGDSFDSRSQIVQLDRRIQNVMKRARRAARSRGSESTLTIKLSTDSGSAIGSEKKHLQTGNYGSNFSSSSADPSTPDNMTIVFQPDDSEIGRSFSTLSQPVESDGRVTSRRSRKKNPRHAVLFPLESGVVSERGQERELRSEVDQTPRRSNVSRAHRVSMDSSSRKGSGVIGIEETPQKSHSEPWEPSNSDDNRNFSQESISSTSTGSFPDKSFFQFQSTKLLPPTSESDPSGRTWPALMQTARLRRSGIESGMTYEQLKAALRPSSVKEALKQLGHLKSERQTAWTSDSSSERQSPSSHGVGSAAKYSAGSRPPMSPSSRSILRRRATTMSCSTSQPVCAQETL